MEEEYSEYPEYPEVISTWEYATMEMESLQMQLQNKKERKHQIDDMLEKTKTSIESQGNSLDEEKYLKGEKSVNEDEEKSLKLEKEIDLLKLNISNAVECEKNAQICLSKEVFSDVSLKSIQQTCEQMRKALMFKLKNNESEKDATLKKMNVNNTNSEKKSLRRKAFQLKENIEHYELEMKTKAKVTSLFNNLHAGISVDCQWHNAVQKVKELTTKIAMLDRGLEEQPVPKLTEKNQQKPKYGDTIKDLKMEQEKELKIISTFESILSKIVLGQSCENENNAQEEQENVPEKQTTQTMYKRRSIKKIKAVMREKITRIKKNIN